MNKIIIALFLTLAVVSAQDCQNSLFGTLPVLQKLYSDYNNNNWAAVEADIEAFLPLGESLLAQCLNVTIPNTPRIQACLNETQVLARLLVPLAVNPNNQAALIALLAQFPTILENIWGTCINSQVQEQLAFQLTAQEQADQVRMNILTCIKSVSHVVPELTTFVGDCKAKADFNTINGDLTALFNEIDNVCDSCGIPKPHTPAGPVDVQACLLGADELAVDAEEIVRNHANIIKIVDGFEKLVTKAPEVLASCGIRI